MLSGHRVQHNRPLYVSAAEKSDGVILNGAYPIGRSVIVYFKVRSPEHGCRISETYISHKIPSEIFRRRYFYAFVKFDQLGVLGGHIYDYIGRYALAPVGYPFYYASVSEGRYSVGPSVIIYLRRAGAYLKLGHHIRHGSHLSLCQYGRRGAVQYRNTAEISFFDVVLKSSVFNGHKRTVVLRPEYGKGRCRSRKVDKNKYEGCPQDYFDSLCSGGETVSQIS